MQASELTAQLREWADEYGRIINYQLGIPDGFYEFLANRLVEVGIAEDDPEVIRVRAGIDGSYRKVRVDRIHGDRLMCSFVGAQGIQLVPTTAVHDNDRSKLSSILEKLSGTSDRVDFGP